MQNISVITINLNNAAGLEKTLHSIVAQKECAVELIVIDGASTDNSAEIIRQYSQHIAYQVSEKDSGIYNAQNKGILKATAKYCLFLNSGDTLANDFVLKNLLDASADKDIVYGDLITRDAKGITTELQSPDLPDVEVFVVSTLWHPTALIRRELFSKFGLYNESFKITGDYEFFIRAILKNKATTKHVSLPVCVFNLNGLSNSEDAQTLQTQERRKSWELNFSEAEIKKMEEYTRYIRSGRLKRLMKKIFKPFSK